MAEQPDLDSNEAAVDEQEIEDVADAVDETETDAESETVEDEGAEDHEEAAAGSDEGAGRKTEVAKPGRANEAIRQARERAQQAEAREKEAQRRADAAESRANERRQVEDQAAERERLALMSPEEKADYRIGKAEERFNQRIAQADFRAEDRADKADFRHLCAEDKAVAAVAAEVEAELVSMRSQGRNVPREALANFLIGKRARERAKAAGTKQRRKGQESIRRETTRPARGRSDTASDRRQGSKGETQAARLARLGDNPI